MIIGAGDARYEVLEGWERIPAGWSHPDAVGVAIDRRDRVHVFNRGQAPMSEHHPVIVYEPDGTFVRAFGEGLFVQAHGIALDAAGNVYCADSGNHAIRKFSPEGELLLTLGTPGVPSETGVVGDDYRTIRRGGPPFNMPTRLAVAPAGDLY